MTGQAIKYQRLSSRFFNFLAQKPADLISNAGNRASLWMGPDHLLLIQVEGYEEKYRRFFYRDLQGVLIQKTHGRRNQNLGAILVGGIILVGALFFANAMGDISGGVFSFAVFVVPLLFLFVLINSALGPGCVFQLRTAVQLVTVPSIQRLSRAEKVLDQIRPHIEAAQGPLSPEMTAASATAFAEPIKAAPALPPPAPASATAHYLAHGCSVAMFVLYLVFRDKLSLGAMYGFIGTLTAITLFSTTALAQPSARRLSRLMSWLAGINFSICALAGLTVYVVSFIWGVINSVAQTATPDFEQIMEFLLANGGEYLSVIAPAFVVTATLGFMTLWRMRAPVWGKFIVREIQAPVAPIAAAPPSSGASAQGDDIPVGPPAGES